MIIGQSLIGLIVVLAVLLSFVVDLPGWVPMVLIGLLGAAFLFGGAGYLRSRNTVV